MCSHKEDNKALKFNNTFIQDYITWIPGADGEVVRRPDDVRP